MDSVLYPGRDTAADTQAVPVSPSLRETVYAQLRSAVLDGAFGPRDRLAELRLAARFGVSRTPVREALARLLSDGLVERGDGGFFVAVPSLAQLGDFYELRNTLELRGIARAVEDPSVRHDPAIVAAELDHWYALRDHPPEPGPHFLGEDERFHTELSRACGNPALTEALATATRRVRQVRRHDFLGPDEVATAVSEHIEILELLRDGRLEEAHRALHAHLGASPSEVREHARRSLTRMALNAGHR